MSGSDGKPLGDRRAEETFAALAAGKDRREDAPEGGRGAGPWKVATFLFLALALALPLAAGVRESRRKIAENRRVSLAQEDVFRVRSLTGDRSLPGAVRMLGDVASSLSELPGLPEAVAGLARAIEDERNLRDEELRRAQAALAADGRRAATHKVALDAILAGRWTVPDSLVGDDAVSVALRTLCDRLEAFDAALAAEDPGARLALLAALDRAWPFPPVGRTRKALVEELASDAVANAALRAAREHVLAGNAAGARRAIAEAPRATLLPDLETIVRGMLRLARLERAAALEASDPSTAIALYRVSALEGDGPPVELTRKIGDLEAAMRRAALVESLRDLAAKARSAGALADAATFHEALADVTGDEAERDMAREARALFALSRAEDRRRQGRLEAALVFAEEAVQCGAKPAESLLRSIESDVAARVEGTRVEQAREALAAGAPDLALMLLRGVKAPGGLRGRAGEMAREQAIVRSRAALFAGDAEGALSALGEGLDAGDLRAHAEFLAGRTEAGVAWLSGTEEEKRMALYRAAAALLPTDPTAAGRLAARARELGGDPTELVFALAAALDAADDGMDGSPLWTALRDEALKRAPLPVTSSGGTEPEEEPGVPAE
jgi:hypothetical protein